MKRIYCNKLEVWKYAVTGHRFFNKTMSRIITFVIVTSCVVLPTFGALSKAGLRQIVTIGGKIACNTFCPAGFYDKPLYYYAENTHPAVIVFGNIFPFVRFMTSGAWAEAGCESGRTEWEMSCDLPGGIAYREVVAANIYVDNENNPDSEPNTDNKDISGDENNCGSGKKNQTTASGVDSRNRADDENNAEAGNYAVNGNKTNDNSNMNNENNNHNKNKNNENSSDNSNYSTPRDNGGFGEEQGCTQENYILPAGSIPWTDATIPYAYESLINYDFVHDNFYVIPAHTALSRDLLKPEEFLKLDLSVKNKRPCILLYHTHSQEAFADSAGSDMTIVQVGDYLAQLLEEKYGFEVIHINTEFDMVEGKLDRSKAYTYAEKEISDVLAEHPDIDMVIDLHRDGVNENLHFVTDINGKATAKVMLFNGISYSNNQEDIDYLYNPYLKENLALTYQMYLLGKTYYPDFFRCIYIEAYRYNLHLCKRSMLIEAGAQTNSFAEVINAMEPLAELIARELVGTPEAGTYIR